VLLAVPNFSEGRDRDRIERITRAFTAGAELLNSHSDPIHNRTVLNLRGEDDSACGLVEALARGAAACAGEIDIAVHSGAHPHIGSLDVCPLVFVGDGDREAGRRAALAVAERIASEGIPVFLYGELASSPERVERAYFRQGGIERLRRRMKKGELRPDLGPSLPHPMAGATMITARPPLAAFNLVLSGTDLESARAIAAELRESGGGLEGVRAIAIDLGDDRIQISTNVHDPVARPLAEVVERVRELAAAHGATPVQAEIVGLVPEASLRDFPADVPLNGFDPAQQVIERHLV
jgi:glutamate formiminotransferase/glutamate formiminotransferase/formiminotetrahydrofolate cyclodeaminase